MHDLLGYHGEPHDDQRRLMLPEDAAGFMAAIETVPLADPERMSLLVDRMGDPSRMDGWQATKYLTDSLRIDKAHDLYWGDLGLLRVCLGNEHATAVFDGNEIDYIPSFGDNSELLKISRLTALLQDGGKVLSVAETGTNFAQSAYNVLIAKKVVESIADKNLSPDAKRAVVLLVGLDVVGGMLQGHNVEEKLAQFTADWPESLEQYREDLMLSSYLSDASAHSAYRLYRNARTGFVEPAVRPDDAQLTFLFERHCNGAITLTPDRCALLLSRLPAVDRLRHLLTGEPSPHAREDDVFAEVVTRRSRESGSDGLRINRPHDYGYDFIAVEEHSVLGPSANIITYPLNFRDPAIDRRYWLPGDGRVWARAVQVGLMMLSGECGPPLLEYAYPDPEVEVMQKKVLSADLSQASDIGQPLSPEDAWRIIHQIENITEAEM